MATAALRAEAAELAILHGHPIYDCLYIAAARIAGCPLVTADLRLFGIAGRAGIRVQRLTSA